MNPMEAYDAFQVIMTTAFMTGLNEAGIELKEITRARLEKYREDSLLIQSVDYTTKGTDGWANQGGTLDKQSVEVQKKRYQISKATKPMSMVFGAGAPYALFVQKGSAPHTGTVGNATPEDGSFEDKMTAWGERYGIPMEEVVKIADYITKHGTKAHPFMPSVQEATALVTRALLESHKRVWMQHKKLPKIQIGGKK